MRNRIIHLLFTFLAVTIISNVQAQDFNTFKDKLYIGGNLGMSFGGYTYIQVAPVLHYAVTEDFILGLGVDYTYYKDARDPLFTYEGSIWGPRAFARYFIYNDFFVHAEYQVTFYKDYYTNSLNPDVWLSDGRILAGGGYRSWIGTNSYMFIMLLFDLQDNEYYFGSNPFIQFGFAAGF